jgi:hypothetical protein
MAGCNLKILDIALCTPLVIDIIVRALLMFTSSSRCRRIFAFNKPSPVAGEARAELALKLTAPYLAGLEVSAIAVTMRVPLNVVD